MKKYKLTSFIRTLLIACILILKMIPQLSASKPNIILFIGDDWTWIDNQAYGHPDVKTPNILLLAEQGMCFDNMFTSTAMCAPTRQQLYTGLFPARSGAFPNHSGVYDGVKSLGHHFKDLGYRVALIGKRHYKPASSFPFEFLGGRGHDNGKDGPDIELEKILPVVRGNDPFFLIVAINQPHTPWNRGNPKVYDPADLSIADYMVDNEETRNQLVHYYAEITYADSLLGYCMTALKSSGKEENTITIFTSEQGYSFPFGKWTCYDLGLKTAFIIRWPGMIKAGSRSQAFVQYVDVVPTLLDMTGTDPYTFDTGIEDIYGNRMFDGISFKSVLTGETMEHRKYTFGIHTTRGIIYGAESYPVRSVRSEKYKYIQNLSFESKFSNVVTSNQNNIYYNWLESEKDSTRTVWLKRYINRPFEELYDLETDPYEQHNLASDKAFQDIKLELRDQLETWMIQQGDLGVTTEMQAIERKRVK